MKKLAVVSLFCALVALALGGASAAEPPLILEPADLRYVPAVNIGSDGRKETQANFDALAKKYNGKTVRYEGYISNQGFVINERTKNEKVLFILRNDKGAAINFYPDDYKPLAAAIKDKGKATVKVEGVFTATSKTVNQRTSYNLSLAGKVLELK